MNLPHVFANTTAVLTESGFPFTVHMGSHWLADDPLVRAHPELFTEDCRYGLQWSGQEPECVTPAFVAAEAAAGDGGEVPISRGRPRQVAGR